VAEARKTWAEVPKWDTEFRRQTGANFNEAVNGIAKLLGVIEAD
jgi:hypothetical protein